MALGKSRIKTNIKGGGALKLRMLSPTPADTFSDAGYLNSTDVDDVRNMMESSDERGLVIDYLEGSSAPVLRSVLKQSGIDEITLVKDADGKYYEAYYAVTTKEGKVQEYDFFIVKIKPGAVLKFAAATERTIELEMHMLAVNASASITRNPVAYNMDPAVNPYYVLTENATAQGAPADTGATVKAAIF